MLTIRSLPCRPTLASMAKDSMLCIMLSSKLPLCLSTHCMLCCPAVLKEQCHHTHHNDILCSMTWYTTQQRTVCEALCSLHGLSRCQQLYSAPLFRYLTFYIGAGLASCCSHMPSCEASSTAGKTSSSARHCHYLPPALQAAQRHAGLAQHGSAYKA